MSDCKDCKQSILSKQVSKIGVIECENDCPEEVVCTGISTYTDCVTSNAALPCLNLEIGATQTEVNQAIDTALCSVSGCYTWTELTRSNLGLNSGWSWAGGSYEKPAVSSVKGCIVRLAGTITKSSLVSGNNVIGTLPVGKRPNKTRRFSVNFTTSQLFPTNILISTLTIDSSGVMTLFNPFPSGVDGPVVSLDSISFETGTVI